MTDGSQNTIVLHPGRVVASDEVSLFELGGTILRHRWRIIGWMALGGILAFVPVAKRQFTYTASASFVPQTTESSPAGLRGLAGQLGLSLGAPTSGQSPQFYVDLLTSPVILAPIVTDTFTVAEQGGAKRTLLQLLGIDTPSRERAIHQGVQALTRMMSIGLSKETGVITIGVTSEWPTVSAAIADRLIAAVNLFNLRTRQSQATEERRFTEQRLAEAKFALRDKEARLQTLLQRNRQLQYPPHLTLERERLQREIELDQEVVTSLAKAYEEVRIREVRDIPLITIIQRPSVPSVPNPKGRGKRVVLGIVLGGLFGVILALVGRALRRRRAAGDPEVEDFFGALSEVKGDVARLAPWRSRRVISSRRPE